MHMEMTLVKNEPKYWEYIRWVRNHPSTQSGWVTQSPDITGEQQKKYMAKHNDEYYICLADNLHTCGYVGAVDGDIRVATDPTCRGKGIGSFMLNELMKLEPTAFAKIKIDNKASIKLFEKCGFKRKFYIYTKEENDT